MRPALRAFWLVVLLAAAPALAQEAELSEARRHFVLGTGYYDAGRYADAAREFEAAYRLSGRGALLFNIARAEQRAGEEQRAIAWLRRYLVEVPDAVDAVSVRSQIEALERALEQQVAPAPAPPMAAPPAVVAASAPEAPRVDPRRARLRLAGFVLLGAGAALGGAGIGLGVASEQAGSQVTAAGGDFAACCKEAESRGQLTQALGVAFDVVGGVALATGAGLLIAGRGAR